jgi:hypothetical protein
MDLFVSPEGPEIREELADGMAYSLMLNSKSGKYLFFLALEKKRRHKVHLLA